MVKDTPHILVCRAAANLSAREMEKKGMTPFTIDCYLCDRTCRMDRVNLERVERDDFKIFCEYCYMKLITLQILDGSFDGILGIGNGVVSEKGEA